MSDPDSDTEPQADGGPPFAADDDHRSRGVTADDGPRATGVAASEDRQSLVPGVAEAVGIFLKGLFMGAADAVPGVSGGTIALVTGIYERLIAAITAADPRDVRHLRAVHTPEGRAEIRAVLERVDAGFLAVLGVGIATAVVTVAQVLEVVAAELPGPLGAFFFGLIAASAVVLYGEVDLASPGRIVVGILGVLFAFLITGITSTGVSHSLPVIAVAGAIAICAMILPGVSGAFLLLVLGQYHHMLGVLNGFVEALVAVPTGGGLGPVIENGSVVAVFMSGAVVGLLTVAHAIDWALEHYRAATLTFLVSLMVGGLRLPAERVCQFTLLDMGATSGEVQTTACLPRLAADPGTASVTVGEAIPVLVAGLVGAAAVLAFDRYTDDLDYN